MARCDHPYCDDSHWGKHSNCLSAALWETDGFADEEGGNSIDWFGYAKLFLITESQTIAADQWSGDFTMNVAPGNFIMLIGRSGGAVDFYAYESAREAQRAYDGFIIEYDLWSAVDMDMMGVE